MSSLDRRELLLASTLGACAPLAWLAESLGLQEPSPRKQRKQRRDLLRSAARRARDEGRPLLVLLLPAHPNAQVDRGLVLGRWLSSDRVEERLDLGLFELACAAAGDVKNVFGPVALHHEPALLWVDVEGFEREGAPPTRVIPLGPTLDSFALYSARKETRALDANDRWETYLRTQAGQLAEALRSTLEAPQRSRAKLAASVGARLSVEARERLVAWISKSADAEPALLKRATAWILSRRAELPADSANDLEQRLGEAIASAICGARVPGSAWARTSGCGVLLEAPMSEDEPSPSPMACGMGSVSIPARRFLWFWNE